MKKSYLFSLFLCLLVLCVGSAANAQITITNFKVDNSATVRVYSTVSQRRTANFSATLNRPNSSGTIPNIRIYMPDSGNPNFPVDLQATVSVGTWSFTSDGRSQTAQVTGTFFIDDFTIGYGSSRYSTIVASHVSGNTRTNSVNSVAITRVTNPNGAITITNFTIDNALTVSINGTPRSVTYRVRLAKDPGYTDECLVDISGANNVGTRSSVITSSEFQTQSSQWTRSTDGTQLVNSVVKTFPLSTADIAATDVNLKLQAISPARFILGEPVNLIGINRTTNSVPCQSNVTVQNNSSLTGTTNSGANLFTSGTVIVRSGSTAAFKARGEISFTNGFAVEAGGVFGAEIDDTACSALQGEDSQEQEQTDVPRQAKVMGVDAGSSKGQRALALYPNPTTDEINIQFSENNTSRELRIYSILGKEVQHLTMQPGQTKVDVRKLPAGIYYIQTTAESGMTKTRFQVTR
jgi:hypothetical protein